MNNHITYRSGPHAVPRLRRTTLHSVRRPRILAISGSLRARSTSTEVLRAAVSIAQQFAEIVPYSGIGDLPHFNPDLDEEGAVLPHGVANFRAAVRTADAILIASPEYAHNLPGSLKNALDWLVSGPELPGKPTGLLNASARATHAQAALAETLRTMSARLVPAAVAVVPLDGRRMDAASIAADARLAWIIGEAIDALAKAI